jgi:hypothetical protein
MKRCAAVRPEVERLADQQHQVHTDEDAEFERAHPARQQYVGAKGQHRGDDPDHEYGAGKPLHHHLVGVAEPRRDARPQSFQRRAQDGTRSAEACSWRVLGACERQNPVSWGGPEEVARNR